MFKSDTVIKEVVLTGFSENNFIITELNCENTGVVLSQKPYFSEQSDSELIEDGKKRFIIYAKIDAEKMEVGPFESNIVIKTSNPIHFRIDIPVTGKIIGDIISEPSSIILGALKPGQKATCRLTISNRANQPFKITRIDNHISGLELEYSSNKKNTSYELGVRYCAKANFPKKVIEQVHIYTDNESQPILKIPLYALITN